MGGRLHCCRRKCCFGSGLRSTLNRCRASRSPSVGADRPSILSHRPAHGATATMSPHPDRKRACNGLLVCFPATPLSSPNSKDDPHVSLSCSTVVGGGAASEVDFSGRVEAPHHLPGVGRDGQEAHQWEKLAGWAYFLARLSVARRLSRRAPVKATASCVKLRPSFMGAILLVTSDEMAGFYVCLFGIGCLALQIGSGLFVIMHIVRSWPTADGCVRP